MRYKFVALGIYALALSTTANASPNIVQNGGFETTTSGTQGQINDFVTLANWTETSGAYNLLFNANTANSSGTPTQFGQFYLYGPNNGTMNGLVAVSPAGGNFVGLDGAYNTVNGDQATGTAISQTLSTIAGHTYAITFDWAAAQQVGFSGPTTEQLAVSLGGQTQYTTVLNNPSQGFQPWRTQTFNFTANAANEVLSFLAIGTPTGRPPFVLLDGVVGTDTTAVPEAATFSLFGLGLALAAVARRRS